jgi:hypothetical protein
MPSKYDPLRNHLRRRARVPWHASFEDVEHVLGAELPQSARLYLAWWANGEAGAHVQALAWSAAGWETSDVDLQRKRVVFRPIR